MFTKHISGLLLAAPCLTTLAVPYPQTPLQQSRLNHVSDKTVALFIDAISDQAETESANRHPEFTITNSFDGSGVPYSGIPTFAHLDWLNCFDSASDGQFDIGITGMPFDLGVSYRPGARFGPGATRMASGRLLPDASWE